jgi:diaminopimelate epimerase
MSERVPFEKYDGAGNDFVVVAAESPVPDRAAFARAYCDRETGVRDEDASRVGADGVLFLGLDGDSAPPRVTMTQFQPDGSTAAMCGNGVRCVAAWAADRAEATAFDIVTPAGTRHATVDGDRIVVEMGEPRFGPDAVPLAGETPLVDQPLAELDGTPAAGLGVTAVNTGVPHAVVFVDAVDEIDIDAVAPPIRHATVFPAGANVTFASLGMDGFDQRTFERGVEGETRACGTGAVAIAAAANRLGRLPVAADADGWIQVTPPGGDLAVAVPEEAPARLRGPALERFEGTLPAAPESDRIADDSDEPTLEGCRNGEVEE